MKVVCEICKGEFRVITNTHLRRHGVTIEEYQKRFPESNLSSIETIESRIKYTKGKTYEEIHGEESGKKLREIRTNSCLKQWVMSEKKMERKRVSLLKIERERKEKEEKSYEREQAYLSKILTLKKVCKQCGEEYTMNEVNKNELFCSHKCFIKFTRENAKCYRTKAFALLDNKCFYCEETESKKLVVHHKDRNPYNNDINNLMILCHKHHSSVHKKDRAIDRSRPFKDGQILWALRNILDGLGLDLTDPNFKDTPFRILKSYYEIFEGLHGSEEIKDILSTHFPSNYTGIVVAKNIHCFSMCPHHFLPVEYYVDFGYIPNERMLGISKLTRLVELLAKQPMLQEEFTFQVINMLDQYIKPKGAIIQVRGRHFCMVMRGVKQDSWTFTNKISGIFETDFSAKNEFQLMTQR